MDISTQQPTKIKHKGCLISIIAFIILAIITSIFKDPASTREPVSTYKNYADLSDEFEVLISDEIELNLKYPDDWSIDRKKIERKDSTLYSLNAVVLAKNGFGVRSKMFCLLQMRFDGTKKESHLNGLDRSKWSVVRLEFY